MKEMNLNDRDIIAVAKVLNKAMSEAEFCFEGTRHARVVTLKLQQYIDNRIKEEGEGFEESLKLNF